MFFINNLLSNLLFICVLATPLIMLIKYIKNKKYSLLRATATACVLIFVFCGCAYWLGGLD